MLKPFGFWSYAREDDARADQQLSELHRAVSDELALLHGEHITLWKDRANIQVGKVWENSIRSAIRGSTFFIPVLSPRYFKRKYCMLELKLFRARQKELGRDDLIFPLHFIDTSSLSDEEVLSPESLKYIRKRQTSEFAQFRGLDLKSKTVQRHLREFAGLVLGEVRREIGNRTSPPTGGATRAKTETGLSVPAVGVSGPSSLAAGGPPANSVLERFVRVKRGTAEIGTERTGRFQCGFARDLWVDPYLVTQELYEQVLGSNPSEIKGGKYPVTNVSWLDAVRFSNKLSENLGLTPAYTVGPSGRTVEATGNGLRLPTECEWEYFASPGLLEISNIDSYAWLSANSSGRPHDVGSKQPNKLGVFDALGNVWEWCFDWYGEYPSGRVSDWSGPPKGASRVCRGGSWANFSNVVSVTHRGRFDPSTKDNHIGFRLVINLNQ